MKRIHILLLALICFATALRAVHSETALLQTDRSVYASGETVYFKLLVLDAETGRLSGLSKVGYLELRAPKSAAVLHFRVSVAEGVASGSFVLPDSLHSDVYQLVAFTALMRNAGEHRFAHREMILANRLDYALDFKTLGVRPEPTTDSLLWIQTDKTVYTPGEPVTLRLDSRFTNASLSVSVHEDPLADSSEAPRADAFGQAVTSRYLAESRAKILRGRVLDIATKQRVQGAIVVLSCPDTVPNLQYAVCDPEGLFQLELGPYYEGKELFLSIKEMPSEQHWRIVLEDNFALSTPWEPQLTAIEPSFKDFLKKCQNIASIDKAYAARSKALVSKSLFAICPQLYYRPVTPVLPSDFVPLDSFPEIAVEILPTVRLYKEGGQYHLRTVTTEQQLYGRNDATLFLDGVYLDDLRKIIPLNSERIRKIDVIEDKRVFGDLLFYGIVSVQTTSNEVLSTQPAAHSLRLKNDTFLTSSGFDVPVPPTDARTPFYKQLLYWNPTVSLQTDHRFRASQNTGTFLIEAAGIAQDGTVLRTTARIEVANPQTATEP